MIEGFVVKENQAGLKHECMHIKIRDGSTLHINCPTTNDTVQKWWKKFFIAVFLESFLS